MIPASAPQAQAPFASEEPPAVANDTAPPPAAALEPPNADDCYPPQPSAPEALPLDATQLEVSSVDASSVAPSVLDAAPIEVVSFEITENHEPLPATNLAASNAAAAIAGATPSHCASIPLQEQAPARANSSYSNNSNSTANPQRSQVGWFACLEWDLLRSTHPEPGTPKRKITRCELSIIMGTATPWAMPPSRYEVAEA